MFGLIGEKNHLIHIITGRYMWCLRHYLQLFEGLIAFDYEVLLVVTR